MRNTTLRVGADNPTVSATAALTFVTLTDSSGGTASDTVVDVPGTYTEATLANQIASIVRAVNRLGVDVGVIRTNLNLVVTALSDRGVTAF